MLNANKKNCFKLSIYSKKPFEIIKVSSTYFLINLKFLKADSEALSKPAKEVSVPKGTTQNSYTCPLIMNAVRYLLFSFKGTCQKEVLSFKFAINSIPIHS